MKNWFFNIGFSKMDFCNIGFSKMDFSTLDVQKCVVYQSWIVTISTHKSIATGRFCRICVVNPPGGRDDFGLFRTCDAWNMDFQKVNCWAEFCPARRHNKCGSYFLAVSLFDIYIERYICTVAFGRIAQIWYASRSIKLICTRIEIRMCFIFKIGFDKLSERLIRLMSYK